MPVGDEIHLCRGDLRALATHADRFRRTLSTSERERCARLRSSRDRWRWALGRGFLRYTLSRYLGSAPELLAFQYGQAGKPSLADPWQPLEFNVSHSGELVLIAVTSGVPVGLDVERVRAVPRMESIARRWFAESDYRAIRRASSPHRRSRLFFETWTRVEATVKATGGGLRPLERGDRAIRSSTPSVWPLEPGPGFVGAVALMPGAGAETRRPGDPESNRMHAG
jgi:4'-phosphopantetheinyl transferase